MTKRPYVFLTLAAAALLAFSCGKGDDPIMDADATISVRQNMLDASSGSVFVAVTAVGDWTITLEYATESGWATVDPPSGTGNKADIRLRYEANEGTSARQVTLVLHPRSGYDVRATVEQAGTSPYPPSGRFGVDVARADWLELPATVEGDGRDFFTHDFAGGRYENQARNGIRNWSFYWDYEEHLSVWVAYPHNRSLIGNGERTNMWGLDPLLPDNLQPNVGIGSYGGGWSRGHQIPSADRLTRAANVSTFYGTNMTPQDNSFNGGIWASLEGKVRDYAGRCDTLYVVTGCLVDGSTSYSGNNYGFRVRIPTHYFKALLYSGNSTYATGGYMAAGFLLPHSTSIAGGNFLDYIMSIDELEEKTGIDFFPNLVGKVGKETAEKIEAETPGVWWK